MPPSSTDLHAWQDAGGRLERLRILERVGTVQVFSQGAARCIAGIHPQRPTVGTIGDHVGGIEVLHDAEQWLGTRGCTSIEGPALLCPWFPYRARVDDHPSLPLGLEPQDRGEVWVEAGYVPAVKYVSVLARHDEQIPPALDRAAALSSRGWRLESFEVGPSSSLSEEAYDFAVRTVHHVVTRSFQGVDRFLEAPVDAVADFYRPLRTALDPRLALIAKDPEGRPVGFLLAVPDVVPDRRWFQILTLAVVPEVRNAGIATWMVGAAHQAARRAGYLAGVHAMIRVGSEDRDVTWFRGEVIRRYALFEKPL
jgi:GNAT superfamily N-acetyltransferase